MSNNTNYTTINPGDKLSNDIVEIIFHSSNNYIVYASKKEPYRVKYEFNDNIPADPVSRIGHRFIEAERILSKLNDKGFLRNQKAQVVFQSFEGNHEESEKLINRIAEEGLLMLSAKLKILYTFTTYIFMGLILLAGLIIYLSKGLFTNDNLYTYLYMAIFGGIGGFISILNKINKLDFSKYYNRTIVCCLCISRVMLSMLCGFVILILLKSNILLGFINEIQNTYLLYILAIVAGFSEGYLPDLLRKIEKQSPQES